jgi:hypothetical protein
MLQQLLLLGLAALCLPALPVSWAWTLWGDRSEFHLLPVSLLLLPPDPELEAVPLLLLLLLLLSLPLLLLELLRGAALRRGGEGLS